MSQRRAVTQKMALRYRAASKKQKAQMLDELCELTGWHRDHARKALRSKARPHRVGRRPARRPPTYGEDVLVPLRKVWAVMGAPAGKRMAPFMAEMVARLRACKELDITDEQAQMLCRMSAATIDRRLAPDRAKLQIRGRSGTKPGSLLKSQIPIRTWAEWDDDRPGFVEIDLVGHDGGNSSGDFCQTLTATDIATGWTDEQSVQNKARKWVFEALEEMRGRFPFPFLGVDSDNGSEFINAHLLAWCRENKITFTRSRPGNKNDGCHVEQKNWHVVRQAVGYHRYDTPEEQTLLNQIYALLRLQINFFSPQQKLIEKHREGSKVTKKYDKAKTPYQRVMADKRIPKKIKNELTRQYQTLNPAQLQRDILTLSDQLLALVRAKHQPTRLPVQPPATRASTVESTKPRKRAS